MSDLALRQSSFLLPEQLAQLGPEKLAYVRKFVENKKIPAGPWKTFLWHSRCKLNSQKPDKNKTSQDHLLCCSSVLEPAKTMNRSPLHLKDSIIGNIFNFKCTTRASYLFGTLSNNGDIYELVELLHILLPLAVRPTVWRNPEHSAGIILSFIGGHLL